MGSASAVRSVVSPHPVRTERIKRGWSQVTLASRAGCSVGTVSLCERGGFLTAEMAQRLADALGVDVAALGGAK